MQDAYQFLSSQSDTSILIIWNALFPVYDWYEIIQPYDITVEDWAELVYSELSKRGIQDT